MSVERKFFKQKILLKKFKKKLESFQSVSCGSRYSRMDQVKNWKKFKTFRIKILFGPFLNTWTHVSLKSYENTGGEEDECVLFTLNS